MRDGVSMRSWSILLAAAATLTIGCNKPTPTVDDASLTTSVQQRIQADSAINTEPIQVYTQNGTVSLSGQVSNAAARTLAANDAASITGVQKVVNNITVSSNTPPVSATTTTPQQEIAPLPQERRRERVQPSRSSASSRSIQSSEPAPVERNESRNTPPPAPVTPPTPAAPSFRNVTVPAGTTIPVRITQTLDSASTQTGQAFSGAVAADVLQDGVVVFPRGTGVSGTVVDAKDATHFSGSSRLSIQLTGINRRGQSIPLSTDSFTKEGAGRGKNTAIKTGVGAAAGAVLGGIFGGGKGAAIGAAAGGGTGAGINAVTRGQQVQIPSETVVRFTTTAPVTVRADSGSGHS